MLNDAGEVARHGIGKRDREVLGHRAGDHILIERVDRRGLDPHQHLVMVDVRDWRLLKGRGVLVVLNAYDFRDEFSG